MARSAKSYRDIQAENTALKVMIEHLFGIIETLKPALVNSREYLLMTQSITNPL